MSNKQFKEDVKIVLDYLWHDEERHYQGWGGYPKMHIFRVLKRLAKNTGYKYDPGFIRKII
jgi:hypothetical protein